MIRCRQPNEALPWALLLDADPSRAMVERYIAASDVYLLEPDGSGEASVAPLGVLVLTRIVAAELEYEIKNIAVAESEQGKGYGSRLLRFAIEEAQRRGARRLYIGTGNSSLDQLRLYQRFGFRIVDVDRDFFTRNYSEPMYENGIVCRDMVRLQLDLASEDPDTLESR